MGAFDEIRKRIKLWREVEHPEETDPLGSVLNCLEQLVSRAEAAEAESARLREQLEAAKPQSSVEHFQRRGVADDILIEAIKAYEDWYKDDRYDAQSAWDKQMKRIIERCELYHITPPRQGNAG